MGWFMVYYSESTGLIINIVVCVASIITILAYIWNMAHQTGMFRRRIFVKFGILLGIQFGAVVLSLLVTIAIGLFIDAVGLSMPWFSSFWMIFGLYFCPMFFIMGILPAIYLSRTKEVCPAVLNSVFANDSCYFFFDFQRGLPLAYGIQLLMHAHCLILTIATIIMISLGIRSAFAIMIAIFFYIISVILNIITCFHKRSKLGLNSLEFF